MGIGVRDEKRLKNAWKIQIYWMSSFGKAFYAPMLSANIDIRIRGMVNLSGRNTKKDLQKIIYFNCCRNNAKYMQNLFNNLSYSKEALQIYFPSVTYVAYFTKESIHFYFCT